MVPKLHYLKKIQEVIFSILFNIQFVSLLFSVYWTFYHKKSNNYIAIRSTAFYFVFVTANVLYKYCVHYDDILKKDHPLSFGHRWHKSMPNYSCVVFLHCHWIKVIMRMPPYLQWMMVSWEESFLNNENNAKIYGIKDLYL